MTVRSNSLAPDTPNTNNSVEPIVDDRPSHDTVNCPNGSSNDTVIPTGKAIEQTRTQIRTKSSTNTSTKRQHDAEQNDFASAPLEPDDPLNQADQLDQLNSGNELTDFAEPSDVNITIVQSHLRGIIEAMVFASDKPLSTVDIAKNANATRAQVAALLAEIQAFYQHRGIQLVEVAGGYAFRTAAAYGSFVRQVTARRAVKFTRAQLETLAIVAYRQPITRPEVDDVRGVDSGPVLKTLLERGVLRIVGKRDEPGRPIIYGTTSAFLSLFNLKSLKDLPSLREFAELSDDSKRTFDKLMTSQQMQWDAPQPSGTTASWNTDSPRDSSTFEPIKYSSATLTSNDNRANSIDNSIDNAIDMIDAMPPHATTDTAHHAEFDSATDNNVERDDNSGIDSDAERNDDVISDIDYDDLDSDDLDDSNSSEP